MKLAAVFAALGLLVGGSGLSVTLTAPTHAPKINVRWQYKVHATRSGKPVRARLTAQIVDPIGGKHPVQFGSSTKNITNWLFTGVFRDYVIWPRSSNGIPLTFRIIVVAADTKKVINYRVTPHK